MESDSPVKPHIIFYNLTSSGASAIVPILNEILADDYGYEIMDGPHKSGEFSKNYEPTRPQFHWTHSPAACFEQYLQRDDFRFVCLYRDPRDVLISHVKDAKNSGLFTDESEEETYLNYIRTDFNSMFHEADEWLNLNQGNVLTLSFEEMKADIPNTVIAVFRHFGFNVARDRVQSVCAKHSFEAVTGRQEGEPGSIIRNDYMFRTGTSGNWRSEFSPEVTEKFQANFGWLLNRWGYNEACFSRKEQHFDLVSAPFPCGVAWLVNVLLELGVKCNSSSPRWGEYQWEHHQDGSSTMIEPAREHLKWHLPSVVKNRSFRFREPQTVRWEHRLDFATEPSRPTIVFTRDGRDAVYSLFRRNYSKGKSFEEYLKTPNEWPDHFPGLFNLPPAESWAIFNLFWLEQAKVRPLHVVRFEDAKAHPVQTVMAVLSFLKIHRSEEEIYQAISQSSMETAKSEEKILHAKSTEEKLTINRRGQPYEWREHFTPEHHSAFEGLPSEALRSLGYDTPTEEITSTENAQPSQASAHNGVRSILDAPRGSEPSARKWLVSQKSICRDSDSMYEFSAEIQALRWTCLIFDPIRIQTRPAKNAHGFFSRILTTYCQTEPVKNCLNLYHRIGEFRGYSLCKNDINVIGLSPILGAHFSPEDVSPEDLDQLSAMGRFVRGNSEDAVKDSLNKILDSINSHAEECLLEGNVKRAIETIKYSLVLTGGKDSGSMEIANKMAKSLDSPTPCVTH